MHMLAEACLDVAFPNLRLGRFGDPRFKQGMEFDTSLCTVETPRLLFETCNRHSCRKLAKKGDWYFFHERAVVVDEKGLTSTWLSETGQSWMFTRTKPIRKYFEHEMEALAAWKVGERDIDIRFKKGGSFDTYLHEADERCAADTLLD